MTRDPEIQGSTKLQKNSPLAPPDTDPQFLIALDELVAVAREGQRQDSDYFNPNEAWLIGQMRVFQDMPPADQAQILEETAQIVEQGAGANAEGKAAQRAGADAVIRLDNGGLAFYSQLGVARRPDLTQYFIDGFTRNRDSLAFEGETQALFAEVFPYITKAMQDRFASGDFIVQTDRRIGDVTERSFHARQLLFGTRYPHLPYMWRQLTFDLPRSRWTDAPDILEVSVPRWLEDLALPEELKDRIRKSGITQLVFKAPTKSLSLHLGFDYMGEHKMGPLSIAMFKVKQSHGLAVQAALSVARARAVDGTTSNAAVITTGPSLHGKSTLTIMIELADSQLSKQLGLDRDDDEGVYPMNDDIVLVQSLAQPIEVTRGGQKVRISHGIDGTENSLYAVPFGLTKEEDPITYDVLRGTAGQPNSQETLENVFADPNTGGPDYSQNPVRNMRMILDRTRLLDRKGVQRIIETVSGGSLSSSVHVPMEAMDRVLWQGVMRQNTVVPPLVRLTAPQYIRALMFGEAVQTGAAVGAIGRPYVEYFSDPFIIGLEDDNANVLYGILQSMIEGGMAQEFYMFNTGGVGAESNQEASGTHYIKIPRELTLMLQEGLLRKATKFEHDPAFGVDVAVALVNSQGREIVDLRSQWLPSRIYDGAEYADRVLQLKQKRYYGEDAKDRAGILRYTKVTNSIYDLSDIPAPTNERELAWLSSFCWGVDQAYNTLAELSSHLSEGSRPDAGIMSGLKVIANTALSGGLDLAVDSRQALDRLTA